MEKEKKPEEYSEELVGESKREFVKKLVTAAGAVAAAGLVAGASSDAAERDEYLKLDKFEKIGSLEWKMDKWKNGFRLVLTGRQLGEALSLAGLVPAGGSPKITIEFTA